MTYTPTKVSVQEIYPPEIEQSDWTNFTTMVQMADTYTLGYNCHIIVARPVVFMDTGGRMQVQAT